MVQNRGSGWARIRIWHRFKNIASYNDANSFDGEQGRFGCTQRLKPFARIYEAFYCSTVRLDTVVAVFSIDVFNGLIEIRVLFHILYQSRVGGCFISHNGGRWIDPAVSSTCQYIERGQCCLQISLVNSGPNFTTQRLIVAGLTLIPRSAIRSRTSQQDNG